MKIIISTVLAMTLFLSVQISANETTTYQSFEQDVQVIDVRTDAEFNDGHHPAAQHIEHTKILEGEGFGQLDKNKPVVLYCRSGGRAQLAKDYLESQGFTNVKNLGGISDLVLPKEAKK
jgi:phage shock protein E